MLSIFTIFYYVKIVTSLTLAVSMYLNCILQHFLKRLSTDTFTNPAVQLLEVMKLDNVNSRVPADDFLELVLAVSELRHPNILELVGYCAEFDQRLFVYRYFSQKTLHDILHVGDDLNSRLSWTARLEVALGAAKALE